jgi:hypothetical protein
VEGSAVEAELQRKGVDIVIADEVRCNEETAMQIKEGNTTPIPVPFFQAAIGISLVVSEKVPVGRVQFWNDGEMVKEIEL